MKLLTVLGPILLICFYSAKAQYGGNNNSMMSPQMANMPSGTGNSSSSKDEPPHGGDVKEAGKYYIEVVYDAFSTDEKLNVWLLKSNYKPAKTEKATAKVKIKYPKLEGKDEEKEMILLEDRFYCNVSEPSQSFTAFITITQKGKDYVMVYNQKPMGAK